MNGILCHICKLCQVAFQTVVFVLPDFVIGDPQSEMGLAVPCSGSGLTGRHMRPFYKASFYNWIHLSEGLVRKCTFQAQFNLFQAINAFTQSYF